MSLAVLFDCDGVLVDSEALSKGLMVDMMRDLGVHKDPGAVLHEFSGRKMSECLDSLATWLGRPLPDQFIEDYRTREYDLLRKQVEPIAGVRSALQTLIDHATAIAVASNGPLDKIVTTLTATDLLSCFGDHVYSAYEVNTFKPDPGLYLHAAEKLGAQPQDCVVVEDSVVGARAGVAAGMRVLGYTDASEAMREIGAQPFDDMSKLPQLLNVIS